MDQDEMKAALKDVISNLVKDDVESARQGIHDVLAAKMRDRINPPTQDQVSDEVVDDVVDDDNIETDETDETE
jgi:hypothetical protein